MAREMPPLAAMVLGVVGHVKLARGGKNWQSDCPFCGAKCQLFVIKRPIGDRFRCFHCLQSGDMEDFRAAAGAF